MSAFIKAAANGLQDEPAINAVIDDVTNELVYRKLFDISSSVTEVSRGDYSRSNDKKEILWMSHLRQRLQKVSLFQLSETSNL